MRYLHSLLQFLSDILETDSWLSLKTLVDPSLKNLVPNMMDLQLGARASSTVRKYRAAWLEWRTWALAKVDVPVIPVQPAHVALFITELANTARAKGLGFSTLESAGYGIAWTHKMGGLAESPTDHHLVKMILEGAKRSLSKPIKPKEPLSLSLVQDIALRFSSNNALSVVRFFIYLACGLCGFFTCRRNLKDEDIRR